MRTDHAETLDVNSKFVALVTLFFFLFFFTKHFLNILSLPSLDLINQKHLAKSLRFCISTIICYAS